MRYADDPFKETFQARVGPVFNRSGDGKKTHLTLHARAAGGRRSGDSALVISVIALLMMIGRPAATHGAQSEPEIRLEAGKPITSSVKIARDEYRMPDADDQGAVIIDGENLTVDFQGATLLGADGREADQFAGRGIVIRGRNITLRGANVHGYKVGIYAEDVAGLRLERCDVSRNYRQRLKSTLEREDLSDWLYGHENDKNEWLRYGAGIYLNRCSNATVEHCRARHGQNGLCLVRSDRARVVDCDFSFLSGWGLAMWRSSEGEVFNNKFDWCIRGYSHGVYSRGQDSAGILVYEQCHNNVFAFNSATHSGDGFFLYAGSETLHKTGRGGCNGNVVYQNDFSHAAANGIEATFSEGNLFLENILNDCDHGVWAGYSLDSTFERNTIRESRNGISIEHGQGNRITGNAMFRGKTGVHLWWDDDRDLLASEFCKVQDGCPSTGNIVFGNHLVEFETGIRLNGDTKSAVFDNLTFETPKPIVLAGDHAGVKLRLTEGQKFEQAADARGEITLLEADDPLNRLQPIDIAAVEPRIESFRGVRNAFLPDGARRGRKYIFVDDWGPYDFVDERVFPRRVSGGDQAVVQLLGDGTTFEVTGVNGRVEVEPRKGRLPARITIRSQAEGVESFTVEVRLKDKIERVSGTLLRADWRVAYYTWSEADDPRSGVEAWQRILAGGPKVETTTPALDFVWGARGPAEGVPADRFAAVATARLPLPGGRYRVRTISDDGVRVATDGNEVLSNWTWHGPTEDAAEVTMDEGIHEFRVEYFEIDGHAQLQFRLELAIP